MADYRDLEIKGCMPDDITEDEIEDLVEKGRAYLLNHGLNKVGSNNEVTSPPFTLFPYPFPEECFNKACQVQRSYNLLVHRVSLDYEFLESSLSKVTDQFTRKLWDIYQAVHKEGLCQKMSLGINRSDYMMDVDPEGFQHIKQVEINTIFAAGATGGCLSSEFYKYILQTSRLSEWADRVPDNKALDGLCKSLEAAWTYYNNSTAVLLFVVKHTEKHISAYDQILIDYFKHEINANIKIIRKTLTELQSLSLEDPDRKLAVDGHEVAVVYYFCGCSPDDYTCEEDWTARLDIERSLAIKCPDIAGQLAGKKKVQQVLAEPGMLERFFSDPDKIQQIRDTFAGQYSLDKSSGGDLAIKKARNNPDQYVIKPQREGGGNNLFGDDIPQLLDGIENTDERNNFVMMDLIKNPGSRNVVVTPSGSIEKVKVEGELGMYGALLGSAHQVLLNTYCGYFVKCKLENADEAGIQSGSGSLSSVILV